MKKSIFIFCMFFYSGTSLGETMSLVEKYAAEVPVQVLNNLVAGYLKNEISYEGPFKSDYVLAEFNEQASGKTWYIVDGYFTLKDKTILFLDFTYDPITKDFSPINNYAFVPYENKRYLLKADEVCNPYSRNFLGVIVVGFHSPGHIDELLSFLNQTLKGLPIFYTDGTNHMIQDLTENFGAKNLFTLREEELIQKIMSLPFVKGAMVIPSGRNPSDEAITQTYQPVLSSCQ